MVVLVVTGLRVALESSAVTCTAYHRCMLLRRPQRTASAKISAVINNEMRFFTLHLLSLIALSTLPKRTA